MVPSPDSFDMLMTHICIINKIQCSSVCVCERERPPSKFGMNIYLLIAEVINYVR